MKQRDLRHLRSKVPKGPIKDGQHKARVAVQPCLICKMPFCHVHHIREFYPRTIGLRVGDDKTVPLCALHHAELHAGNAPAFWDRYGIDPKAWAEKFYAQTLRERDVRSGR